MPRTVTAAVQLARDEGHVVRLAAARGAGYLSLAELRGELPAGAALAPLVPLFVCLLGTDQSSDVQRQQLSVRPSLHENNAVFAGTELQAVPVPGDEGVSGTQVLRTLALTREDALTPFLGELVPSIVSLVQQTLGPTKLAAERTLARILHVRPTCSELALIFCTHAFGDTSRSHMPVFMWWPDTFFDALR